MVKERKIWRKKILSVPVHHQHLITFFPMAFFIMYLYHHFSVPVLLDRNFNKYQYHYCYFWYYHLLSLFSFSPDPVNISMTDVMTECLTSLVQVLRRFKRLHLMSFYLINNTYLYRMAYIVMYLYYDLCVNTFT